MTDDDRYMTPPYKQRVTGSNPVVPTLKTKGLHENVALFYFRCKQLPGLTIIHSK